VVDGIASTETKHRDSHAGERGKAVFSPPIPAYHDAMETPSQILKVTVWRGGEAGDFATYEVPLKAGQTVLDLLGRIQRELEPSLAYRYSCRAGVCGSCAMTVNGRPRWTCRTLVSEVEEQGNLEIAPLANLPVIKDLVTDMTPFFEKWQKAKGRFYPGDTEKDRFARIRPDDPKRKAIDAAIECIGCGVCFSACDVVKWNDDYLGPAALNRAWSLTNDVRDGGQLERLRAVAGSGGCRACHSQQSCAEHCPKGLNPTAAIAGLKREIFKAALGGKL